MDEDRERAMVTTLVICGPPPPADHLGTEAGTWQEQLRETLIHQSNRTEWLKAMSRTWETRSDCRVGHDVGEFIRVYETWWALTSTAVCGMECDWPAKENKDEGTGRRYHAGPVEWLRNS